MLAVDFFIFNILKLNMTRRLLKSNINLLQGLQQKSYPHLCTKSKLDYPMHYKARKTTLYGWLP